MLRSLWAVLFLLVPVPMVARAFGDEAAPDVNSAQVLGSDPAATWVLVDNAERLKRHGRWTLGGGGSDRQARNRYCWPLHLVTDEPGAKLELEFQGVGIVAVFHTPRTPAYGPREARGVSAVDQAPRVNPETNGAHWVAGLLQARIDDREPIDIHHNDEPLEVVLADDLPPGRHRLVLEHVRNGCTLLGFRILTQPPGHLEARVTGENPQHLFDVRISVWRDEELIRTWLHRNWLCDRVAVTGLPPGDGYRVRIEAVGWEPWEREGIRVAAGENVELGESASDADATKAIVLRQHPPTVRGPLRFPAIGNQAVRLAGEMIEIAPPLESPQPEPLQPERWRSARLARKLTFHAGSLPDGDPSSPTISRSAVVEGNILTLPGDVPPGLYDLHLIPERGEPIVSPRSIMVRSESPSGDLTILTWGHTDTWGQLQAEFEQNLVSVADIIGPDLVLVSNSVNAAYIAGAMTELNAPYLINFGNHRIRGHEHWYGSQVGVVDFGSECSVFNFGFPWDEGDDALPLFFETGRPGGPAAGTKGPGAEAADFEDWPDARQALDRLVTARQEVPGKIVNGYEGDAPVEWLNRHDVRLIHAAHGGQRPKVGIISGTSTMHVGKRTASSFRIVRMEGHRVVSATDPPLELDRVISPDVPIVPPPPVRIVSEDPSLPAGNNRSSGISATAINELPVRIDAARVVFLVPAGNYRADRGRIVQAVTSDDGQWAEVTVRIGLEANSRQRITLHLE